MVTVYTCLVYTLIINSRYCRLSTIDLLVSIQYTNPRGKITALKSSPHQPTVWHTVNQRTCCSAPSRLSRPPRLPRPLHQSYVCVLVTRVF